jgi:uncharacterized membrane protein YozB (DUF420 family)
MTEAQEIISILTMLIMLAIIIFFLWFFYIRLPRKMARKRGRDPFGWMIIFWIISPLWGAILLLVAGDYTEKTLH